MRTILVAIDGSEESCRAVRMASAIGKAMKAKLTLAHVEVPLCPPDYYSLPPGEFGRQEQKMVDAMFGRAFDLAAGLETERRILMGLPAEALAEAANAPEVDLVVVGSRGRGAVKRVLQGSVSDRLIHICEKPVLVVQ